MAWWWLWGSLRNWELSFNVYQTSLSDTYSAYREIRQSHNTDVVCTGYPLLISGVILGCVYCIKRITLICLHKTEKQIWDLISHSSYRQLTLICIKTHFRSKQHDCGIHYLKKSSAMSLWMVLREELKNTYEFFYIEIL